LEDALRRRLAIVRVALRAPDPPVLAVVPAMAWLLLAVPRDTVSDRPAARVETVNNPG